MKGQGLGLTSLTEVKDQGETLEGCLNKIKGKGQGQGANPNPHILTLTLKTKP